MAAERLIETLQRWRPQLQVRGLSSPGLSSPGLSSPACARQTAVLLFFFAQATGQANVLSYAPELFAEVCSLRFPRHIIEPPCMQLPRHGDPMRAHLRHCERFPVRTVGNPGRDFFTAVAVAPGRRLSRAARLPLVSGLDHRPRESKTAT
jgi:hypothetical protein